ncbi:PH domain-containing protein [Saccharothrix australiensis]|uniref:Putative membrane protein n=1 Tax=Saccharothrix australiensis TaxID=2072 RepID=A0A495W3T1_9PSEU|nr:PH domain-containing protein [Saccharothrix australiensis]RKT54468.1 putative membrane protein [Saccharothrix australiensis]
MSASTEGWERLHPRLVIVGASWFLGPLATTAVSAVLAGGLSVSAAITLAGFLAAFLVMASIMVLRWISTRYRITDTAVEIHSGLVFRRKRATSVERIRSVDVTANPVHRLFGLATVVIGTGEQVDSSDSARRLALDGVTRAQADELRTRLLRRAPDAHGDEATLARMDWAWLKYGPLTIWSIAGVGVALGGLYRLLESFGLKPYELGFVKGVYYFFADMSPWAAVPLLVAIVVGLGALGSTALFVESWWNFRLSREDEASFRVQRGLLTTRSLTVDRSRVRGAQITEPLALRMVGAARTNAIATGLGTHEDRSTSPKSALLPPAPIGLAHHVVAEVLGLPDSPQRDVHWRAHPRVALRRRLFRVLQLVLPPVAVVWALGLWLTPVLVRTAWIAGLVCLLAGVWLAFDAYRNLGHGLSGDFLVVRSGTFARRAVALRRDGVVAWEVSQSPFQRWSGLVTLTAAVAAGRNAYRVRDVAVADGLEFAERAVPGLLAPFLEERGERVRSDRAATARHTPQTARS